MAYPHIAQAVGRAKKKKIKHVGFKGAVSQVMNKGGYSKAAAGRIIGYGKAHASMAAKRANPHLMYTAGKH